MAGQVQQPAISAHIVEVSRHLIGRCCERDNSFFLDQFGLYCIYGLVVTLSYWLVEQSLLPIVAGKRSHISLFFSLA
jgi:hypothetical protein